MAAREVVCMENDLLDPCAEPTGCHDVFEEEGAGNAQAGQDGSESFGPSARGSDRGDAEPCFSPAAQRWRWADSSEVGSSIGRYGGEEMCAGMGMPGPQSENEDEEISAQQRAAGCKRGWSSRSGTVEKRARLTGSLIEKGEEGVGIVVGVEDCDSVQAPMGPGQVHAGEGPRERQVQDSADQCAGKRNNTEKRSAELSLRDSDLLEMLGGMNIRVGADLRGQLGVGKKQKRS